MTERSIFISGGAGGIGLATARLFAGRGWRVGIGDVDDAAMQRAGQGGELETFRHDVRDPDDWDRVLDRFCATSDGALDVLVNNAGLLSYGWFEEQSAASQAALIDVNVIGVVNGANRGLPRLRRAPGSCLVNIASQASLQAAPRLAVYSATKFAVRGLSEALALEWLRLGVRVACLEPTVIDTPMLDHDDAAGQSFRAAVAGAGVLGAGQVAETIWQATHGDALHYPVGDTPGQLLAEITPRLDDQQRIWRERLGLDS